MKEIRLDASKWQTRDDFYDALLPALGAPAWHGRNLDALTDSISSDEINEVRLPFRFLLVATDTAPLELRSYLKEFADLVADLPMLRGADVALICEPPL
jgi:RNAse (barnase) inhibitor barstar